MAQIFVKGEFSDTLSGVTDRSELFNEQGELIGVFMPLRSKKLPMFNEHMSADEMERRRQEKGGRTWSEIRADLEAGLFRVPSISDEEIQRRRQHTSERTLADIWAKLGVQR